jgi:hypothetical protein
VNKFSLSIRSFWPLFVAIPLILLLHIVSFGASSGIVVDIRNSLHAPGFGALAVLTVVLIRRRSPGLRAYFLAFVIAILIGIVGELIQIVAARSPSLQDLVNDAVGILGFLFLASAFDQSLSLNSRPVMRTIVFATGVAGLILSVGPVAWQSYAFVQRARLAPVLLDFESAWQTEFLVPHGDATFSVVSAPGNWPVAGQQALLVQLGDYSYSGLGIEPITDWSDYSAFSFVMASADNRSLRVTVRISDRSHTNEYRDRFNKNFVVTDEPQRITIPTSIIESAPRGRAMKMDEITLILVFISDPGGDEKLLLDDFRLVND